MDIYNFEHKVSNILDDCDMDELIAIKKELILLMKHFDIVYFDIKIHESFKYITHDVPNIIIFFIDKYENIYSHNFVPMQFYFPPNNKLKKHFIDAVFYTNKYALKPRVYSDTNACNCMCNCTGTGTGTGTGTVTTTSSGSKLPDTLSKVADQFLRNIISALNNSNINSRYSENYKTVVDKTEELKTLLDTIIGPSGDLKKLSTYIQSVTQKLIELKYIEPKLISVKLKDVDTLYGRSSWILETTKDVGKEFPVLSETKVFYEKIKKVTETKIDSEGELSDDKINAVAIAILANIQSVFTQSDIYNLFLKLIISEKGMDKLVDIIIKNKPLSIDINNNRTACDIFYFLVSNIGRANDKAIRMVENIRKKAIIYRSTNGECDPTIPGKNPFNQTQGKGGNKQPYKPSGTP